MWIVTANIGRKKSAAFRRGAIDRVRGAVAGNVVIGWQEIDEADTGDEHGHLRKTMPWFTWAGFTSHVPVGIRRWKLHEQHRTFGHPGIAKISPQRVITEAVIGPRVWKKKRRLVVLNVHTVAGAFTNPGQPKEALRREYWNTLMNTLRRRVRAYHRLGYTVVVTGDFNAPQAVYLHGAQRHLIHSRLDQIIAIEAPDGVRLKVKRRKHIHLGIDGHKAHAVKLSIR